MTSLIEWKDRNNIPNAHNIESQIDLRVLENAHDNYQYNPKNDGMSFWKMLFMPPKYHKLIDSRATPFFNL